MTARLRSQYVSGATVDPATTMPGIELYWWWCEECGLASRRTYASEATAVRDAVSHNNDSHAHGY